MIIFDNLVMVIMMMVMIMMSNTVGNVHEISLQSLIVTSYVKQTILMASSEPSVQLRDL